MLKVYLRKKTLKIETRTLTLTLPFCFSISPRMADINEDFPQPTCPTIATSLPRFTSIDTLLNTIAIYYNNINFKKRCITTNFV